MVAGVRYEARQTELPWELEAVLLSFATRGSALVPARAVREGGRAPAMTVAVGRKCPLSSHPLLRDFRDAASPWAENGAEQGSVTEVKTRSCPSAEILDHKGLSSQAPG